LAVAKQTILSESESITKLIDLLDENFADAAQEIYHSNGRLVVTGIGKALSLHKNGGHLTLRNTITVSSRI
jgi:D-arabinose 5-phosphate isomerase GutQ